MAVILPEVYEGNPITFNVYHYSIDEELVLPSSLTYTVIDRASKTVMQSGSLGDAEVVENGLEKIVSITVTAANNGIVDQSNPKERRIVAVTANGGEAIGRGEYSVVNVRSIGVT